MMGITRGVSTLLGAAVAGFLIWLSSQVGNEGTGGYWATHGLLAAAGLTMAISQILGGWTKWGWPRLSRGVFLLGFLPVLVAGGWLLLSRQPSDFFNTSNWSRDLGIDRVVSDLGEVLSVVAFGLGLTFGLCFDTAGPRRPVVNEEVRRPPGSTVRPQRPLADEPPATGPVRLDTVRPETGRPVEETAQTRKSGDLQSGSQLRSTERDDA